MKWYRYKTSPEVCSSEMLVGMNDDGTIGEVRISGGCPGSLAAISKLVVGRKPAEVVALLKGIPCGGKATSCPDQLAVFLEKIEK